MDRTARFFDLSFDTAQFQHLIETQARAAKKAVESTRLAAEGLRFRKGD
jgi:hypothetical protein